MSGIINKAKQAIHEATAPKHHDGMTTHTTASTVPEGTAGPHNSRVVNAADPRVDSDLDNRGHPGNLAHTSGTTHTTHTTGTTTGGSTNAGPHSSNLLNKVDPRVDSDLDRSRNAGLNQTTHTGHTGHTSTTGTGVAGTTHGSTNAGPHDSNLLNKLDPRVDSDLDRSRNAGLNQTTHTTGTGVNSTHHTTGTGVGSAHHTTGTGINSTHHTTGTGVGSTHHTTGTGVSGVGGTTHGSTNAGPHDSNLLNKLDPRVDSDLDRSRNAGLNQTTHPAGTGVGSTHHTTGTGIGSTHHATNTGVGSTHHTTGTGVGGVGGTTHGSTNAGPHDSNLLNKLDPRVDSNLDGSRNAGLNQTTHHTTGPTTTTTTTGVSGTHGSTNAGPHSSNLLNKVDPRVDSDLDHSRNAGLNQTTRTHY